MEPLPFHPDTARLAAFLGLLVLLALGERLWPRRPLTVARAVRWRINLAIVALDSVVVRLVLPLAPFALAAVLQDRGWGLFNVLSLSGPAEIIASVLLLDLTIYAQHRLFHHLPLLWRIHRMHHTDLDLDVTSGTRFHPVEIVLSLAIKLAVIVVLGSSPLAVVLFEIVLNATSMFSHANLRLPPTVDRWLRLVVVTPDMHRVHHSVIVRETNSNYGFNLPWWDRLFGSYRAQPGDGHLGMTIGLREWRHQADLGLWSLLQIPFLRKVPGQ